MTVTIDLPEDALERLRAEAKRRGVSIELVIAELPDPRGSGRRWLHLFRLLGTVSRPPEK